MEALANAYGEELSSKFRTLNLFTSHGGEIGRAHEHFIREVLERLLPSQRTVGTGFIFSGEWRSGQQDILVYSDYQCPVLFRVGDCVVLERRSVDASMEVKTQLTRRNLRGLLPKVAELRERVGHGFVGIYAWDGAAAADVLDELFQHVRDHPEDGDRRPDAILVAKRGWMLLSNKDGRALSAPYLLYQFETDTIGKPLLALMRLVWSWGNVPDWIMSTYHLVASEASPREWPDDILRRVQSRLSEI